MNSKHQPSSRRNSGFTLPEVMVATALSTLVMSQVVVALITSQRLFEATLADLELSLHARALREKVLFNITPEDGGLMNISQSDLTVENVKKGWGNGVKFKPAKGQGNRLALGSNKKLKADRGNADWFANGAFIIRSDDIFQTVASNGTVAVNLDLAIQVNTRTYGQRHRSQAQIVNP